MFATKIGNKKIGTDYTYVIAEIGSNFDGSLTKAKKLIKTAKECGADAAKFQSFLTEELLSKKGFEKKLAFQKGWSESVWDTYKKAELPRMWHKELKEYADSIGIDFFTSPWDCEAVDLLEKLKVPAYKIGSGDITFHKLLKHIASKHKPILLATGASDLSEVSKAIKVIKKEGNNKIILMHSVVQYPSAIRDANLRVLITLRNKFNLPVGYSDHSPGILIPLASVAIGACVIEKHFSLNTRAKGPDHPHSMNPESFANMVREIRLLNLAMGDGIKRPTNSEKETRIIQRRGIWTISDIRKGDTFTEKNVKALRPSIRTSASKYEFIIGKKAKRHYEPYEAL